ncbi:Uncharacterized protein FWK35_00037685, partial [Aphis craccivora]
DKEGPRGQQPPPLLRSSTLPAIIVPGLNILHAQIGPNSTPNGIVYHYYSLRHRYHDRDDYGPFLVTYLTVEVLQSERLTAA